MYEAVEWSHWQPVVGNERKLQNLEAVAKHLAQGTPEKRSQEVSTGKKPGWYRKLSALGPLGVLLAFVLGKLKLIVPLLKVTKMSTLFTMFLAVWVYAMLWGLPFAFGFVLLIFVHELGHALVMQQQGIRAGAPVFIPFVGAVIAMKSLPRNAYVEALVGIGGPLLGSVGALACLLIGWQTGSLFWYALAYTGFLINLFNLIPISPLDGGRIVGVISRWLWLAGYLVAIAVFLMTYSPILFLILLLGLFSLGKTLKGPSSGYFDVTSRQRLEIGMCYFGLLILLAIGMWVTEQSLESLRPQME